MMEFNLCKIKKVIPQKLKCINNRNQHEKGEWFCRENNMAGCSPWPLY